MDEGFMGALETLRDVFVGTPLRALQVLLDNREVLYYFSMRAIVFLLLVLLLMRGFLGKPEDKKEGTNMLLASLAFSTILALYATLQWVL